jgi:hypothetical protein
MNGLRNGLLTVGHDWITLVSRLFYVCAIVRDTLLRAMTRVRFTNLVTSTGVARNRILVVPW